MVYALGMWKKGNILSLQKTCLILFCWLKWANLCECVCVYLLVVLMYTCRGVDYAGNVSSSLFIKNKIVPRTFSLDSCVLDILRF